MKQICLNEDNINAIRQQFESAISKARQGVFLSDTFSFSASCAAPIQGAARKRASVVFLPQAYLKMLSLLREFDSEVAWHGVATRESENLFRVTDIIVYPQIVTGTTVNTDQEAYNQFMMNLDDETYNHLHFQGHSHVNMSTNPSSTDLEHQKKIVSQLTDEDFYIFMIWNKKLEWHGWIYDKASNTIYEKSDISVSVVDSDENLSAFLTRAKELVQKPQPKKKAEAQKRKPTEEDLYVDSLFDKFYPTSDWACGNYDNCNIDERYWKE